MGTVLERYKPRAGARTQLLFAAGTWTAVGIGLAAAGVRWSCLAPPLAAAGLIALGAALGTIKGLALLRRAARSNAGRIVARGDGRCAVSFQSWRGWVLVAVMMATGIALRRSHLPRTILGPVYVAVGVALVTGATALWGAWRAAGGHGGGE